MSATLLRECDDINEVIRFLARRDLTGLDAESMVAHAGVRQADLLILLGGITTPVFAEEVARAYRAGFARKLMVVGGKGHSTQHLRDAIAADDRYRDVPTADRAEADMLGDILIQHLGLSRDELLIERESTNCGNNAEFALRLARANGLHPAQVVLVMDPIMQRRTGEAFRHHGQTGVISFAPVIPLLRVVEGALAFADPAHATYYRMESFLQLVMGEIPRLRDDENGYGPRGRGFIGHVEIPERVEQAFVRLNARYGGLIRKAKP